MTNKIELAVAILFVFLCIFNLLFGIYLSASKNKELEKIIYPCNKLINAMTKNGGVPLGILKAGEYGIHFFLLIFVDRKKNSNIIKTELRDAPTALKLQYLAYFFSGIALFITAAVLNSY